jgi:predicted enzyme related to lactoylglutathione lyase
MNAKMSSETNAINWFEISAVDIKRAKNFYETIFDITMEESEMPGMKYAMFPFDRTKGKITGGIAQSHLHTPGGTGSIIYLNANPDLQVVLDRIEKEGCKIISPKTAIGPNGFIAFFIDTEGNTMALHSNT